MNSTERLLAGLFDYAGMYPPASLPFEDALRTAAAFARTLARPYLVGADAVLAVDLVGRLTPGFLADCGFEAGRRLDVAVLGPPGDLESALRAVPRAGVAPVRLVSYEIKLPAEPARAKLADLARATAAEGLRLYVEPSWQDADYAALAGALRELPEPAGLKVRGSGPTAVDIPALARAMAAVNAEEIPFKATAGLHHPLVEPERYANDLGFLSLVVALRLGWALGPERFTPDHAQACLAARDLAEFRFEPGVAWRDFAISERDLTGAAATVPLGIGSCSLTEPDADLTRLLAR